MRITLFLILFSLSASAQSFSVFNIDASGFPAMKAEFYALGADGAQKNPSTSEITVTEDGVLRNVLSISCPVQKGPTPLSLAVMVDTYSGIALAREGAGKLINEIAIPPGEAGITVMDHGAFIVQDLTQRKDRIATAISKLTPAPGVDLETMFYDSHAGGVPFLSGRPNKKILVLISDLHCPKYNLDKSQLFADCAREHISVYVVLIGTNDYNGYFKEITAATGGALYEKISTLSDLDKVVLLIGATASGYSPCQISWQSNGSCIDEKSRKVDFAWNAEKSHLTYPLTPQQIFSLTVSPRYFYLGGKPAGKQFDTTLSVTASNTAFSVTDITSSDVSFTVSPKSFSLAAGETKTLTVSFTPADSTYIWAQLDIHTDLCDQSFFAAGGYPGKKPKKNLLKLLKPNGGEVFLAGSDTTIEWSGTPLSENIGLSFSSDNGASWQGITSAASEGTYGWHVPQVSSNKCLVKADERSPAGFSPWPVVGFTSGTVGAGCNGIASDLFGNIYVTGYFDRDANFDGAHPIQAIAGIDMFVAKFRPDATIEWIQTAGSIDADEGRAIAVDPLGNVYVTGYFSDGAIFGGKYISTYGTYDMFVAKYKADGTFDWMKHVNCRKSFCPPTNIALDDQQNIYIVGIQRDSMTFDGITVMNPYGEGTFFVKYHSDGTVEWAKNVSITSSNYGCGVTVGPSQDPYITGGFSSPIPDGKGGQLTPYGSYSVDIFVSRYKPDGTLLWAKQMGGTGDELGKSIVVDKKENIYVSGVFDSKSADFGGITMGEPIALRDAFLVKLDPNGKGIWAKRPHGLHSYNGGGNYATAWSVAVDDQQNVGICGYYFVDTLAVDTARFPNHNSTQPDVYVAIYNPDGSLQSARSAGGYNGDWGVGITASPLGFYAIGSIATPAVIGPDILTGRDSTGMFIWKMDEDLFQSDTSDAVFSIIMPTFSFSGSTIDMGQVETFKEKDSLVAATLCNTGGFPLHVLGMDVTGGDKAEFMIMSGAGDFTLQPGECRDVMFSFMPMVTGNMSATVTLRTANGDFPDTIKILGEGIAPQLAVIGNVIDFGQVRIGSYKDTIVSVAIQNIGGVPVNFSPGTQLGPDVNQFVLQSGAAGFTLAPGAAQNISLRFAPKSIGRTSGRIGFVYNGPSSPAILNVFGQGLGGLVSIKDDSGYAGDHKNIPMILEKVPVTSVQSAATNFSARIAYDKTVLYSSAGSVQHGARFDTITVSGSIGSDSILANLPFVAMLGESTTSPMNIVEFNWLDGAGQPADFDAETESGTFHLLGICPAGGTRLYNPDGQVSMTHINPNPSSGIIHIEIQTTETGRTQLALVNVLGQQVVTISDGELKPGLHSFDLNTHDLSAGSYFLTLTTPTVRRVERVDVEK